MTNIEPPPSKQKMFRPVGTGQQDLSAIVGTSLTLQTSHIRNHPACENVRHKEVLDSLQHETVA